MHNEQQQQRKVALPPEIAEWMGAPDRPMVVAQSQIDVPAQRGWRERLRALLNS